MSSPFPQWSEIFPIWNHSILPSEKLNPFLLAAPQSQEEWDHAQWIVAQEKVELHIHLEAAVSANFYEQLNEKYQLFPPEKAPTKRLPFQVFREFLLAWFDHTLLVRDARLFEEMVIDFARLRQAENIVYSEVHVSPLDFCHFRERFGKGKGLEVLDCLRGYVAGAKAARREFPQVRFRFIVDAEWPALPKERDELLSALKEVLQSGEADDENGIPFFCAVGLGGPELPENIESIKPFLDECRELGLKVDIHTGETTSAVDHAASIRELSPDRIAHGISGAPLDQFFDGHISMCPTSNILTGSWKDSLNTHPVAAAWEQKKNFSISTDDPLLFASTLSLEYVALFNAFGWEKDFFHETQKSARAAAFSAMDHGPEAVA